jgi:hypothetical protein
MRTVTVIAALTLVGILWMPTLAQDAATDKDQLIRELEARVRLLEAENASLKAKLKGTASTAPASRPVAASTRPAVPAAKSTIEGKSGKQLVARAAELLKQKTKIAANTYDKELTALRIEREPAIGRIFILTNLTGVKDADAGMSSQIYISLAENGDVHFRIMVRRGGEDWLFLNKIMLRLDKEETVLEVDKPTSHTTAYGVSESGDVEISEDVIKQIIAAKKAYVTAIGTAGRQSVEIFDWRKDSLKALLEYADIIREIGPVEAKLVPKD